MADNLPKIEQGIDKAVDVLQQTQRAIERVDASMGKMLVSFQMFEENLREQARAADVRAALGDSNSSKVGAGVSAISDKGSASKDSSSGMMGKLGGIGAALGSFGAGAGLGIGAAAAGIGVALFGLAEVLENFDAQGVKDGVETLLSIGDGYEDRTEFMKEGGALGGALAGIGVGLLAFSVGAGAAGLAQFVTEDDWAQKVKGSVETLLSIETGSIIETGGIVVALSNIGAGLLAFNVGAGAAGFAQFVTDDDWAQKVKGSLETLLSIETKGVMETAGIVSTMSVLGAGLLAFNVGVGASGLGQFATGDDWAQKVKGSLETLLSIETKGVMETIGIVGTMTGLSAGLVAFNVGVGASGLGQFATGDDWAQKVKGSVETLLSIGTMTFWETAGLVATLTGIGAALAVYSAGTAAAGVSEGLHMFSGEPFAERIKKEVETLLSIAQLENIGDTKTFVAAMTGIGAGLAAFALGKGLEGGATATQGIISFFGGENEGFADRIKREVSTLLSITDGVSGDGEMFKTAMGNISSGLMKFAGGQLGSALADVGTSMLNFLSGTDSPIQQVMQIAEKADDLTRGADALGSIADSLNKFQAIKFDGSDFNIKGFANDLKDAVPLIEGAIMGDDGGWFGTKILGLASAEIDFEGAKRNITMLRDALNVQSPSSVSVSTAVGAVEQGARATNNAVVVNNIRGGDNNARSSVVSAPYYGGAGMEQSGMRPDRS